MNYVWQELCRQRNALARLMLGSLPRDASAAAQTAAPSPVELMEQRAPVGQPGTAFPERSEAFAQPETASLERYTEDAHWEDFFPENRREWFGARLVSEGIWVESGPAGAGSGADAPLRPAGRQSAMNRKAAAREPVSDDGKGWPRAVGTPMQAGGQLGYGAAESWGANGAAASGKRSSRQGQVPSESGPAAEPFVQGKTAAQSRGPRLTGTQDTPQVRMVTELTGTPAPSHTAAPAALSRAFERDARRYDGGFELYP